MTFDEQAAALDRRGVVGLLESHQKLTLSFGELVTRNDELSRQLEWFKRQIFSSKSERRLVDPEARQLWLGEPQAQDSPASKPSIKVAEHQRHRRSRTDGADESGLRFDESVPVEVIRLPSAVPDGEEYVEVSEKVVYRLAQRPASYVVLKFIRTVVKHTDGTLSCPPAAASVLGKSLADVSLLACLAIDKFQYHLPLYRQHQRMKAAGIHVARSTLTGLVHRSADLLEPIYHAQLDSILKSEVLTMDETPIKAGRRARGTMRTGYFWPVYGDKNEIAFPFSPSRAGRVIREVLGEYCGVLLSDGYKAYENYAAEINGVVHAQCWSHTRRYFIKAEDAEPALTTQALNTIGRIYEEEAALKRKNLRDAKQLEKRSERCG